MMHYLCIVENNVQLKSTSFQQQIPVQAVLAGKSEIVEDVSQWG